MKNFKANIIVTLKPAIKDVKAVTLEKAVSHLIQADNLKCRTGNTYSLEFQAENKEKAQKILETIASEILSNSVIEEYEIEWL